MELLERYLQEIRRYLPEDEQADIVAEISDDVQSQMEARESELGRRLEADEEAAIVQAYGHPRMVAARYRPSQYVIGPEVFPFYWYTVKIVLASVLALALTGITIGALVSKDPLSALGQGFAMLLPSIFWPIGVVTLLFVILERTESGQSALARACTANWNPRTLPGLHDKAVSRVCSLFEAILNIAALLWLLDFPNVRHSMGILVLGPAVKYLTPLAPSPAWHAAFVLFFAGCLAIVLLDLTLMVHPEWTRARNGTLVAANVLYVCGACIMLPVQSYVVLAGTAYAPALAAINESIRFGLIAAAAICLGAIVLNVRAFLRKTDRASFNVAGT